MNILIAGGAGFIGSHLTETLLEEGNNVVVVDNFITGNQKNIEKFSGNQNFRFYEQSITSPEFLKTFMDYPERFDYVYDLACPTGVPNIDLLGEEMLMACSVGTWQVLMVAQKHAAKFLLTSSSEVYGEPEVSPQAETYTGNVDPVGPRANYEEGKRFSETLAKWFADHYELQAKIVRLFNVYGPNMSLFDTRVVPRFGQGALTGGEIPVQGDGSQRRTLCYIDDLINGLRLVIDKGNPGEIYNLGSDQEVTILQLAETINKLTGNRGRIIHVDRPAHDHNSRMPDLSKIQALGWQQTVALDDGLQMTLASFELQLASHKQMDLQA